MRAELVAIGIVGAFVGACVGAWLRRSERTDQIAELVDALARGKARMDDLVLALKRANEDLTIADREIASLDCKLARLEAERTEIRQRVEAMVEHCRRLDAD